MPYIERRNGDVAFLDAFEDDEKFEQLASKWAQARERQRQAKAEFDGVKEELIAYMRGGFAESIDWDDLRKLDLGNLTYTWSARRIMDWEAFKQAYPNLPYAEYEQVRDQWTLRAQDGLPSDSAKQRRYLFAKDQRNGIFECPGCTRTFSEEYIDSLDVDHIVPQAKGGTTKWDNLQLLCRNCNISKGDRDFDEWQSQRQNC